jgi:hypothetical protein
MAVSLETKIQQLSSVPANACAMGDKPPPKLAPNRFSSAFVSAPGDKNRPSAENEADQMRQLLPGGKEGSDKALELVEQAAKKGAADDLIDRMRQNGTLRFLGSGESGRLGAHYSADQDHRLAEALVKGGASGRNLRSVFTELSRSGSPLAQLDSFGRSDLGELIQKHAKPEAKIAFVGEMANTPGALDTPAGRRCVANALGSLRGDAAGQAWAYLQPDMQRKIVTEAATEKVRMYANDLLNNNHAPDDPKLLTSLVQSAMSADVNAKATVFSATSEKLEHFKDNEMLLDSAYALLKTDVRGITRQLRRMDESGKAATLFSQAMMEPALSGFWPKTEDQFVTEPHIQKLGSVLDELRKGPTGRAEDAKDFLNDFECNSESGKTGEDYPNARSLFHWGGAIGAAQRRIANSWKVTSTGRAIAAAAGLSTVKDVVGNWYSLEGEKRVSYFDPRAKAFQGAGFAAGAFTIAYMARDYYRGVALDARTAAAYLTDPLPRDPTKKKGELDNTETGTFLFIGAQNAGDLERLNVENVATHHMLD